MNAVTMNQTPPCPECGAPLPKAGYAGLCPACVAGALAAVWREDDGGGSAAGEAPRVPGWTLETPLGAGGQGVVWRGVMEDGDAVAAVKVFRHRTERDDRSGRDTLLARVENEAALLRKLDHPGIVRLLDAGFTEDGRLFLATELVEGCDLQRLLQASRISADRALEIAAAVADALAHAHERGVVHRDVKPANVIVSAGGGVRLVDFSLASDSGVPPSVTLTAAGLALGTPYYVAPEVMAGKPATAAADLYALGVLMYEMLTGGPPVGRFARVSQKAGLPREVDGLIEALLAEEPGARGVSAAGVAERIRELRRLLATGAARRLRRRRWRMAGAAAGLALLAGGIGYQLPRTPVAARLPLVNASGFPNPEAATREAPFTNSLGMIFIPVAGRPLLAAVHETQRKNWAAFMAESAEWSEPLEATGGPRKPSRTPVNILTALGWVKAGTAGDPVYDAAGQDANLPADGINIFMARRFCAWLTWAEQRTGRLGPGQLYRLPTDEEWSALAGVADETGGTPQERHLSLAAGAVKFPWGAEWPPPAGFANYAGSEVRESVWPQGWQHLPLRSDAFPAAAPVASFSATEGLYDLWGNVWEWCESTPAPNMTKYVLRGGSWVDGGYQDQLRRDFRRMEAGSRRESCIGFRCVLEYKPAPR